MNLSGKPAEILGEVDRSAKPVRVYVHGSMRKGRVMTQQAGHARLHTDMGHPATDYRITF